MPSSDHDKRLCAELAAELGLYPADPDDESIARHCADAARKKTDHDPAKKWVSSPSTKTSSDLRSARRHRGRWGPLPVWRGRSRSPGPLPSSRGRDWAVWWSCWTSCISGRGGGAGWWR